MSDKSKQRARALGAKTGMSHQAAVNQLRKNKTVPGPKLPAPTARNIRLDSMGSVMPDDPSQPEFERVEVQEFDAADFDKTCVPCAAFDDPKMRRDPSSPAGEKVLRIPSLNEYIAARAEQTGWKLMEVRPGPATNLAFLMPPSPTPVPGVVLSVTLIWDRQASKNSGHLSGGGRGSAPPSK